MNAVRKGTILAEPNASNGYHYVAVTDDNDTVWINPLGVSAKPGDTGTVRYVSRRTSGFFVWDPAST